MQHKDVGLGNIHQIHNYEFDTIAKRDEFIPSLEDLKLICLVNSPFSYYSLKSLNPIEWKPLSTITINLEDFSVLSAEDTIELLNAKQNIYDITSNEYKCGYSRGGKEIFGIEVDCGALPNGTTKIITIPNYNDLYNYWIDTKNSYSKSKTTKETIPIPFVHPLEIKAGILIEIYNKAISITTNFDRSNFTETKIVLNYTKG